MLQTRYEKVRLMARPLKDVNDASPFGRWLRDSRTRRGLTMEALAEIAETSQVAISNIERGNRNASRDMVEKLARALLPEDADEYTARALLSAGLKAAGFATEDVEYDDHEVIEYLRGKPPTLQDKAMRMLKAAFDEDDAIDNAGNIGKRAN